MSDPIPGNDPNAAYAVVPSEGCKDHSHDFTPVSTFRMGIEHPHV